MEKGQHMRKGLYLTIAAIALGACLFGCDSAPGANKPPVAEGAAAPGGGTATAKGGSPATGAPAPVANPNYTGGVGSKVK